MIQILLIVQIVVTILMIITILLQRNTSDGLGGMGGGNMPTVSTDSAGPLAKLTGWLGAIFLINCLAMAAITSRGNSVEDDIMDELGANARIPVQTSEPIEVAPDSVNVEESASDMPQATMPLEAADDAVAPVANPDLAVPQPKAAETAPAIPAEPMLQQQDTEATPAQQ